MILILIIPIVLILYIVSYIIYKIWYIRNYRTKIQTNSYDKGWDMCWDCKTAESEMYEWLKLFEGCDVRTEEIIYFKGKSVKRIDYFPAGSINFVFKDSYIKFELPCICGFYKDEQHLHP